MNPNNLTIKTQEVISNAQMIAMRNQNQQIENLQFSLRQGACIAVQFCGAGKQVDCQIRKLYARMLCFRSGIAAKLCLDARFQYIQIIGLGDIPESVRLIA